ncbi:hypothetical protein [Chryseolinea sp. H1M3-3]|uniref:hypothetical protein n=1 Tax=Chryseolinea sp. H1M3-3 TaxID=3034144 RepID=UPI0023ED14F1|nr:hypothetical protein [Chryseolinea sp. H1M3-3]
MKQITAFLNRPFVRWAVFILVTVYPTIDFYLEKLQLIREMNLKIDWILVIQILPRLVYGIVTGLLFLLFIKAQSSYYKVEEVQKELLRLNQLYKERFKMIKFGDTNKLFSKDFEKNLWRNRLYLKEPDDKRAVDEYIEKQYKYSNIDYNGVPIPLEKSVPNR